MLYLPSNKEDGGRPGRDRSRPLAHGCRRLRSAARDMTTRHRHSHVTAPRNITDEPRSRTMASSTVRPDAEDRPPEDHLTRRLLESAATLAYDPATEVDWDTPLDKDFHGASPEWSTLYGTAYWGELTEDQRKELTRQEAASVASTGIWFEMILQQMVLRDVYAKDPTSADVQWALTEIAEECRHSIMFARGAAEAGRPALPAAPARGGARAGVQDTRVRRGGVRGDPRRRGGPRRHAARLDAGRAGRALRPHHQQHPCRRGIPAHEVRPRGDPQAPQRRGPGTTADQRPGHRHRVVRDRHQHGEQGRVRQRRTRWEACHRARRRPTSTTSR